MSVFTDIADQWQITQEAFSQQERQALNNDDDMAFDAAGEQKKKNDQAYFLFLFTRFEAAINQATRIILDQGSSAPVWAERRIWVAWGELVFNNNRSMHFLSKAEILTDKSRSDYAEIKKYYNGRNKIAHGGVYDEEFLIPEIAQRMSEIVDSFLTS